MDPRIDTAGDIYQLTGVSKTYRKSGREILAVRELDLCIKTGEWLAVQGPTGHGKTTLLQLLGGLDRPTAGAVDLAGQNLATMRETRLVRLRARDIGFVFQTFNLIHTLSAQENVETALVPLSTGPAGRQARAAAALASVGLA